MKQICVWSAVGAVGSFALGVAVVWGALLFGSDGLLEHW